MSSTSASFKSSDMSEKVTEDYYIGFYERQVASLPSSTQRISSIPNHSKKETSNFPENKSLNTESSICCPSSSEESKEATPSGRRFEYKEKQAGSEQLKTSLTQTQISSLQSSARVLSSPIKKVNITHSPLCKPNQSQSIAPLPQSPCRAPSMLLPISYTLISKILRNRHSTTTRHCKIRRINQNRRTLPVRGSLINPVLCLSFKSIGSLNEKMRNSLTFSHSCRKLRTRDLGMEFSTRTLEE
ncbi:unnamed protein product [Moneuplotes crassus]|uniref:Uncharacterized protein n=1 Tax=Euplotes crassus TaxID=5936 RepID=A0AAD1UFQ6_EUPCR|nr:unnamed protein product [Moneuplotes crassus]